jgi:hypothetical protein
MPQVPQPPPVSGQAYPTLQQPFGVPPQGQPAPAGSGYPGQPAPAPAAPDAPATGAAQASAGAYVSTHSPPATAQPGVSPLDDTAAGRPVQPVPVAPRPAPSRLAPILVGVVALMLLAGGAGAWVVMGKRRADPTQGGAATASASASAAPADSASAAAADSASAAPADSASAAPTDSASAAPADSGTAAAGAPDAGATAGNESTIACDPECDEIRVDDKVIELGKPVDLAPGKHTVLATKSGYLTVKETVVVKAGQTLDKTFKLREKPAAPTGPAAGTVPAGPAKPCGKFLKRGAGCK